MILNLIWVDGFTITVWIAQSFIEGALRIIFYLAQTSIGKWHFLFYRRILFRSPQEMVFLIKVTIIGQSSVIQCIALWVIIKRPFVIRSKEERQAMPLNWHCKCRNLELAVQENIFSWKNLEVDILCDNRICHIPHIGNFAPIWILEFVSSKSFRFVNVTWSLHLLKDTLNEWNSHGWWRKQGATNQTQFYNDLPISTAALQNNGYKLV